ncbi:MAG: GDP-mannose 4,6-dehydratase [Desulfobacterales bacterium]
MADKILITGGAGFIGCHCAKYFAEKNYDIVIVDNLSRKGTPYNLKWLKEAFPVAHYNTDVRNFGQVADIFKKEKGFAAVIHLAAQVAVTTSVVNPREDFNINALGAFNLLECLRNYCPDTPLIYASTNKVYGYLPNVEVIESNQRYTFKDKSGIGESQLLDFHSPYGCSKGCADQYVIDYARIYGLRTVSFRQSCIYGERQFGVEDQGWVAWFIIAGVLGMPITIYGDGKQVRDILFISDLIELFDKALNNKTILTGEAYNIGGGTENTLSLLELIDFLKGEGLNLQFKFEDWRPGDQKVYISDSSKAWEKLNWRPKVSPSTGIRRLMKWVQAHKDLIRQLLTA